MDQARRTAARRYEEQTEVFRQRYAKRSGIESTNSGLKNRLSLGWLRVRGRGAVFRTIVLKVTGWNVLRASASKKLRAASKKLRAMIQENLIQLLGAGWARPFGKPASSPPRPPVESCAPKRLPTDSGRRFHAPQNHFKFCPNSPPDICRKRQVRLPFRSHTIVQSHGELY